MAVSEGHFHRATSGKPCQALLRSSAPRVFSASSTITRLKAVWGVERQTAGNGATSGRMRYVHIWVDGIYISVRMGRSYRSSSSWSIVRATVKGLKVTDRPSPTAIATSEQSWLRSSARSQAARPRNASATSARRRRARLLEGAPRQIYPGARDATSPHFNKTCNGLTELHQGSARESSQGRLQDICDGRN